MTNQDYNPHDDQPVETPHDDPLAMNEPLFDPEDTPRSGVPAVSLSAENTPRSGIHIPPPQPKTNPALRLQRRNSPRGWLNVLMIGAAFGITAFAAFLYLQDNAVPRVETPTKVAVLPPAITEFPPTDAPTETPIPPAPANTVTDTSVPPDVIAELLLKPGYTAPSADMMVRMQYPYTVAPARTRSKITEYVIQPGDTLEKIANRFGISQDTLIWNNDITYVNRLQPGEKLTILPENGILYTTTGDKTIQQIAEQFKVTPYRIIDSEYNTVWRNADVGMVPPAGFPLMIPGGVGTKKAVYWNPGIARSPGSSGSGGRGGGTVSFGGGSGSCGAKPDGGGTGSFRVPLPPIYIVGRGYSAYHSGIDLQAPIGTTVFASDSGTVIFAGWSNWGYGNSVVIAHGGTMTLYGHMDSISVSCGQTVGAGQPVGTVGNTGNSTGPHLHFEIRVGDQPVSPSGYLAF